MQPSLFSQLSVSLVFTHTHLHLCAGVGVRECVVFGQDDLLIEDVEGGGVRSRHRTHTDSYEQEVEENANPSSSISTKRFYFYGL